MSAWTCNIHGKIRLAGIIFTSLHIDSFWMDRYPVTNAQFKKFLDAAHYHPKDDLNFLRDWQNDTYPGWMGQQASDLGFAGRCAGLCGLGREAASARVGMAIRRPRRRRKTVSMGQHLGCRGCAHAPIRGAI